MVKHVILWSVPRCVSTAFERSIRTMKNCQVLHEPFSSPYYFGPERQSSRFASTPIDAKATYDGTADILQAHYPGKKLVFAKDMAYYIDGKFEELFRRGLDRFTHTFIIRRPERAVYSLFKTGEGSGDEWVGFDPKEAGFREMHNLYTFVQEKLGYAPVVVDADDLLADPEGMMKAYCSAVGIPYEENMTKWEPGPISDWEGRGWGMDWYEQLLQSSGIIRRTKKSTVDLPQDLPREVSQCIAESKPFYEALYSVRLLPAPVLLNGRTT